MEKLTAQERKERPIYSGFVKYFPLAMAEVAHLSKVGNDQHNPGMPLFWDRSKSKDELDALTRHLVQAGTRDTDGEWHDTKVAWRAMANLEKLLERQAGIARAQADAASEDNWYERNKANLEAYEMSPEDVPTVAGSVVAGVGKAPEEEILPEVSSDAPEPIPGLNTASFNLAGLGDVTLNWWSADAEGNTSDAGQDVDAYSQPYEIPAHSDEAHDPMPIEIRRTSEDLPFFRPLSDYRR